jgi:DNA-binding transcriptional LysR family regulator
MNDLRLIGLALALSEHGNFRRAADALNLSQPSLSRGIAELERSFGVPLFDRTRKGVVPTAFGRVLLDKGSALLREAATLKREIELLAGMQSGEFRVSASPVVGESVVAIALGQVSARFPKLRVSMAISHPDQVVDDLLKGRSDLGVANVYGSEHDRRLVIDAMEPLPVYFACRAGHPLTNQGSLSLQQVLDYPLAAQTLRGEHAEVVAAATSLSDTQARSHPQQAKAAIDGDARGALYAPQITVSSLSAARLIALHSDAIFVATAWSLADDLAVGRLVRLPVDEPAAKSSHGIIRLADRSLGPAEKVFIELLREVEAQAHQGDVVAVL